MQDFAIKSFDKLKFGESFTHNSNNYVKVRDPHVGFAAMDEKGLSHPMVGKTPVRVNVIKLVAVDVAACVKDIAEVRRLLAA